MERKIGEIFEYNGEWYQCVESDSCGECSLFTTECGSGTKSDLADKVFGQCSKVRRTDNKHVIFKKLEKVGEPITVNGKNVQLLKTTIANCDNCAFYKDVNCDFTCYPRKCHGGEEGTYVEIKTKEDMEEKKLIELLSEKVHNAWMKEKEAQGFSYGKDYDKEKKKHPDMLPYNELKEEVKEYDRATVRAVLQAQKELQNKYNYNNLKSFDLEAAKAGKSVCTRDGRKARIICFDRRFFYKNVSYPILALVECSDGEDDVCGYTEKGKVLIKEGAEYKDDLMMLPEKKEGWVNVYYDNDASSHRGCRFIYDTKERAVKEAGSSYITTVKINWEE